MIGAARAILYTIAVVAVVLGLWGIVANLAIPLMPHDENARWDFYGPFADWDPSKSPDMTQKPVRHPWWALSFQTACPYLDSWLAGPVGYGFYALCLSWGLGTILLLRSYMRTMSGGLFLPRFLFGAGWLIGLGGIVAHVMFFASIAREVARAGLTS